MTEIQAQPTREAMLTERRKGIGGSDVAAILELDTRKTRYQLWREKVGLDSDGTDKPAMRRGRFLEPAVLERYAAAMRVAAINHNVPVAIGDDDAGEIGLWRRGNIDAVAYSTDDVKRIVECKTVTKQVFRSEWGTPWTDEVPDRALCQGLWYASLVQAPLIDFAVLVIPDDPDEVLGLSAKDVVAVSDLHIFQAGRSPAAEAAIIEKARAFWRDHVLLKIPPDPLLGSDDVSLRWPVSFEGQVRPAAPIMPLIQAYEQACSMAKTADEDRQKLRDRIMLYAEGAEALMGPDGKSPWLTMKTQRRAAYQVPAGETRPVRFTKWYKKANPSNQTETEE